MAGSNEDRGKTRRLSVDWRIWKPKPIGAEAEQSH
jgi:hypothetical protein